MERMLLVYTTFPDAPTALSVGEALVRARRWCGRGSRPA